MEYGARIGVIAVVPLSPLVSFFVSETLFEGLDGAVDLPLVYEQQAEVVRRHSATGRCKYG